LPAIETVISIDVAPNAHYLYLCVSKLSSYIVCTWNDT